MKGVKLADIAKKTGYSVNTVSHALLNKPDISEKTREYIKSVADEMGYIANVSAGALRSGKSKTIAIIVGDISNPHFSIMIKEMEVKLRKYGYSAFILNTDEDEKLERAAIISAISKNVDGIIICPVQKTHDNIDFINKNGLPYVLIGRRFEENHSNYVICDDVNGGYVAAEYLINMGHKKILFITGSEYISSSRERLEGARRAVADNGLFDDSLVIAEIGLVKNDEQILYTLKNNDDCTGVICFSDMIALQVCYYLKRLGKSVPQDKSVIGFDNIASKFYLPLMLTSVTSSKTKMSNKAVDTLMEIINEETESIHQYVLPTKIVSRESTERIQN